jgi:beta-carotene hydroxylase
MSRQDEDLKAPRIAWPTIVVAIAALATFAGSFVVAQYSLVAAAVVATIAIFAAFTPVHEAAHHNVARSRFVNGLVGHACVLLLMGSLGAYRFLHGEHHKHTNKVDDDPDRFSGTGPSLLLPLRWATQDLAYLVFYGRHWSHRPLAERLDLVASAVLYAALVLAAVIAGERALVVVIAVWLVPSRVALVLLAWTFDWLPHRPHSDVDRHRATTLHSSPLLSVLMLGQNFHLVHHLFPGVPFYRYTRVWNARRRELVALGARDRK